jgi:flavin reductase (DIM6/NTAB) family NADH-FMN oxidoreductase RutF
MDDLAAALGRVPSGLYIVTAVHRRRRLGMVASWVMQAGFEPPLVTVALQNDRPIVDALETGAECVLNILPTGAKKVLVRFGNLDEDEDGDPFDGLPLLDAEGPPILADAHAYLRGRQKSVMGAGDHRIHLIAVEAGKVLHPGEQPMVHVRRSGMNY